MAKADGVNRKVQNKLNATLRDIANQIRLTQSGKYVHVSKARAGDCSQLDVDSWRWIFVGTYLGWKSVPAIEGHGFVMLGKSSRLLTDAEAGEVIDMAQAFGAVRDVFWTDPEEQARLAAYEAEK